uniref:Reverse transcriptase domain-containing protein n=1 Tax=Strongyloides papillosus TaxID=174720 RepID=A0A0N5B4Q1_STREA
KPGSAKLITNTRPIAILQGDYKLFTSMLLDKIRNKIECNLDREQAGFRQRKNTITNTFILKTIMQKTTEFKIPLFIIFIDFKKAFDSIEHSFLFSTLGEIGLSLHEIKIIQELYKDSRMLIPCLRSSPIQIFPSKDVKQGDSLSPVLFIVALQGIISSVKNGLKSNHLDVVLRIKNPDNDDFTQLFYLAYADDIAIFSTSQDTSEFLASSLEEHPKKAGLQLNRLKTENLRNSDTIKPIYQVTQQYKYLGQRLSFNKNHENLEISTRIRNSEIACKKVMPLMERTNSIKKKAFLYVQNIRPILTYGIETLNYTKASLQRILNAEKKEFYADALN